MSPVLGGGGAFELRGGGAALGRGASGESAFAIQPEPLAALLLLSHLFGGEAGLLPGAR